MQRQFAENDELAETLYSLVALNAALFFPTHIAASGDAAADPFDSDSSGSGKMNGADDGKEHYSDNESDSDSFNMEGPITFPEEEVCPEQRVIELALASLAAMAHQNEDLRLKIANCGWHKRIHEIVDCNVARVRSLACLLIVSLTRSDTVVRSVLSKDDQFVNRLMSLLWDPYLNVRINAMGAICNIALPYQRKIVGKERWLERIAKLTQAKDPSLRQRAVLALKNLVFMHTPEIRRAVMSALPYDKLLELLDDEDPAVQLQALCVLRNLLYRRHEDITDVSSF